MESIHLSLYFMLVKALTVAQGCIHKQARKVKGYNKDACDGKQTNRMHRMNISHVIVNLLGASDMNTGLSSCPGSSKFKG
jgi:hypothetical protein